MYCERRTTLIKLPSIPPKPDLPPRYRDSHDHNFFPEPLQTVDYHIVTELSLRTIASNLSSLAETPIWVVVGYIMLVLRSTTYTQARRPHVQVVPATDPKNILV
jgi:hypothetical protein